MTRLPISGQDEGTWGDILNDFLSQVHQSDGTLKANSVSALSITDGAVSEAKLDSATQTKLNTSSGVSSVNTRTGAVTLTKTDVGLTNVDNTSDLAKPISTSTQAAIDAAQRAAATVQSGTTYILALADAATVVEFSSASAVTVTVPPNSSIAFPVGTVIELLQYGAGQLTVAAGGGVTVRSTGGLLSARAQYSSLALRKRAADEWVLAGDLT